VLAFGRASLALNDFEQKVAQDSRLIKVSHSIGTPDTALAHAARLPIKAPEFAAEQLVENLGSVDGYPHARLVPGASRCRSGTIQVALEVLEALGRGSSLQAALGPVLECSAEVPASVC
jgi:hypothetical protein